MAKELKVVLLGYMSSGKSTIGKLLGEKLKLPFKDLDTEIEQNTGMTVTQIFDRKGELFFRKKETEVLRLLLRSNENFILALGGGTPCYGNNLEIVNLSTANSFYLKLRVSSLVERIASEKNARPLVANISNSDLPEFIGKHLFERNQFYQMAKNIIDCDSKIKEVIVNDIVEKLV